MKITFTSHPLADWFFPKISVRILRLLQIALGLVTLGTAILWSFHLREFFTSAGYAPASYVLQTTVYSHLSIFFLYDAPWFVYICFGIFILALLGMIFGRGGRISTILVYLFFISFASRFPLVFYGAIDHLHSMLFFSMLHPAIAYKPWKQGGVKERDLQVEAWSIRMMQICLCLVYFYASAQKVRSNTWWNGTEIIDSLSTRFGAFDFSWLRNFPIIINIASYGSWMLEGAFPFLIWKQPTHRAVLLGMIGLHIGILITMNASLFSEIMIASLLVFVMPEDEIRIKELWDTYIKRLLTGVVRSRSLRKA